MGSVAGALPRSNSRRAKRCVFYRKHRQLRLTDRLHDKRALHRQCGGGSLNVGGVLRHRRSTTHYRKET